MSINEKTRPTLSPLEALVMIKESAGSPVVHEGWSYALEGSELIPPWLWSPAGETWSCSGGPGDEVTSQTEWVQ